MLVIDPLFIPEVVQNFTTNQPLHPNLTWVIPLEANVGLLPYGPQHGNLWDSEGISPVILNLNNSSWEK